MIIFLKKIYHFTLQTGERVIRKIQKNILNSIEKLFHQLTKFETNNLNYSQYQDQDRLKKTFTNNIKNSIKKKNTIRWYYQRHQDITNIIQKYGKPDLFVIMT